MDWIKVRLKHIDYDMESAPDSVFRSWIKVMALCAGLEKKPSEDQMIRRVGNKKLSELIGYLEILGINLDYIFDKIMEDVEKCQKERGRQKLKYGNSPKIIHGKYTETPKIIHGESEDNTRQEREGERELELDKREDGKIKKPPLQADDAFLEHLKTTYTWVDMDFEMKKLDGWLLAHPGKKKTRQRIINWLNKCDKPLGPTVKAPQIRTEKRKCWSCEKEFTGRDNENLCPKCHAENIKKMGKKGDEDDKNSVTA